jgi:glycosyltransferase involved in cell wall biosynthesis
VRLLAVHQGGGLGGAPVSLLKLLAHLPFETSAVFTESGPLLEYAHQLGVPARVAPTGGALYYSAHARLEPRGVARFVGSFPTAVQRARAVLRQARPDLVHLNTSVLLAWAVAARREQVPVVWMVREVLGPWLPMRRWQASFIQRHACRIVAVSGAVRACFPPDANVSVVYNAVDLDEFRLDVPPADLELPADGKTVVMLGSVQRAKGHWLMLDALTMLAPPVRLVLVTGGVDDAYRSSSRGRVKRALRLPLDNLDALLRDAATQRVGDRIHVTGWRRDIPNVLTATDILVFPSLAPEGFGRPIIEAMAMARPVVATDVGPSRELLGDDAGLLVPPDPRPLSDAVALLLDSPAQRAAFGRAGRTRVEAQFGLEQQVTAMTTIYREVAPSA